MSAENDAEPIRQGPRLVSSRTGPELSTATSASPPSQVGHAPTPEPVRIITNSAIVAAKAQQTPPTATFTRQELNAILYVYGRMVAAGEWKDYAIDFSKERATFSVYRRTSEMPIYRIEKQPKLARKQGAYSVVSQTGLILKRGPDLGRVLAAIDKRLRVVEA